MARYFNCWVKGEHRVHGAVDISKGIYQSCDVFFYTLAERLGIEKIAKWATAMGLSKKTGIDLPNEVSGIMPSEEWKMKTFRQKWYAGEVISVGIGQGAVTVSPIQLARTIGGITMGGTFYRPHVVDPEQLPEQFRNTNTSDHAGRGACAHRSAELDHHHQCHGGRGKSSVSRPARAERPQARTSRAWILPARRAAPRW